MVQACGLSVKVPIFHALLVLFLVGVFFFFFFTDLGLVCWPVYLIIFLLLEWIANAVSASLNGQPLLQVREMPWVSATSVLFQASAPQHNGSWWLALSELGNMVPPWFLFCLFCSILFIWEQNFHIHSVFSFAYKIWRGSEASLFITVTLFN